MATSCRDIFGEVLAVSAMFSDWIVRIAKQFGCASGNLKEKNRSRYKRDLLFKSQHRKIIKIIYSFINSIYMKAWKVTLIIFSVIYSARYFYEISCNVCIILIANLVLKWKCEKIKVVSQSFILFNIFQFMTEESKNIAKMSTQHKYLKQSEGKSFFKCNAFFFLFYCSKKAFVSVHSLNLTAAYSIKLIYHIQ